MARGRSPNRDKAFELYKESNGEIQNREIANILGIPEKTVSAWKSRYKWDAEINAVLQKKDCSTTNVKKSKKVKKERVVKEVEEVIENDDLTDKQRLFCIYYVKLFNATKAYQKAYECDYVAAMTNGSRMLRNDKVREEIERLKAERMNGAFLSTDDLLQKYIDIAFADITDYLSFGRRQVEMPDGSRIVNYVDLNESSEVDGTIVTEVSQGKDGVKVKLADKMRALDFLAKNMGLLSFDVKERLALERERLELSRPKETESREDKLDQYLEALQGMMADD